MEHPGTLHIKYLGCTKKASFLHRFPSQQGVTSISMLSCGSLVSVKEDPERKSWPGTQHELTSLYIFDHIGKIKYH